MLVLKRRSEWLRQQAREWNYERERGREKARKEEKVRDSLAEAGIFFLFLEPKTSTDPNQCLHLCNNKNLLNKFKSLFNKMTHTIRLIKSSDPIILRNILSQLVQNLLANVWKSTLRRLVGKTTFGLKCDGSKEGRWRSHRKVYSCLPFVFSSLLYHTRGGPLKCLHVLISNCDYSPFEV